MFSWTARWMAGDAPVVRVALACRRLRALAEPHALTGISGAMERD